jgi:DNA-directed RNA polymerase specialized sigma24 family protein
MSPIEELALDETRHAAAISDLRKRRGRVPAPAHPPELGVSPEEWEEAWFAVLAFAYRTTHSMHRADDIRQESYLRLMTTRRWTRESGNPFVQHMLLMASSILKHENKARDRRERYQADGGAEYKRERGTETASVEQDMLEHAQRMSSGDRASRMLAELRRKLAGYPLELRLMDHAEQVEARGDEFERPAELARILGVRVNELYRALARIRRYKEGVQAAVDEQLRSEGHGQAKS